MHKKWTNEENEKIRLMRGQGFTYKQMVPHFPDRNLRTISVQANKLLEPSKKLVNWSPDEEQKLIELRTNKIPYKEIAEILGRSYPAVKTKGSYLMSTGTTRSSDKKTPEEKMNAALSDLSGVERVFIETGQEFFRF